MQNAYNIEINYVMNVNNDGNVIHVCSKKFDEIVTSLLKLVIIFTYRFQIINYL